MSKATPNKIADFLWGLVVAVLILSGFSTFIGNWASQAIGYEEAIKAFKEVLVVLGLVIGTVAIAKSRQSESLKKLILKPVNLLAIGYVLLNFLYFFIFTNDVTAEFAALNFNLRFIGIFFLVQFVSVLKPRNYFLKTLRVLEYIAWPIVIFGVLQALVLPKDILSHFGYTFLKGGGYIMLNDNPEILRIQSFLKGPNELGGFLAIVLSYMSWRYFNGLKLSKQQIVLTGLSLIALYFTYSRSAWGGLVAALLIIMFTSPLRHKINRSVLIKSALAIVITLIVVTPVAMSSTYIQTTIFHNELGELTGSGGDHARLNYQLDSIKDLTEEPFGYGLGTAGPSSFYNPEGTNITESYFLQQGVELGLMGLLLFVGIVFMAFKHLIQKKEDKPAGLALSLLVVFTLINLVLHGWSDGLNTYIWWVMFGAIYSQCAKKSIQLST